MTHKQHQYLIITVFQSLYCTFFCLYASFIIIFFSFPPFSIAACLYFCFFRFLSSRSVYFGTICVSCDTKNCKFLQSLALSPHTTHSLSPSVLPIFPLPRSLLIAPRNDLYQRRQNWNFTVSLSLISSTLCHLWDYWSGGCVCVCE